MVSAARRQIIGGGGAPINKSRRRPQIGGGGGAARPVHGSSLDTKTRKTIARLYSNHHAVNLRLRILETLQEAWPSALQAEKETSVAVQALGILLYINSICS